MKLITSDNSNMTRMQLMEGYVELSLNMDEEQARTGKYPLHIATELLKWMRDMQYEDVKKAEEVLSNIRSSRAMGNL